MSAVDDLIAQIFGVELPELRVEFERWVRGSRRYRAFSAEYATKIRAKLRSARDGDQVADVRAELRTAMLLLRDERFALVYEKYAASRQRGPDFTLTFRTHTPFNVEVRRLRLAEFDSGDSEVRTGKLMAVLCDKTGQMPPGIINVLWLAADGEISEPDVADAAASLRRTAEQKDEAYFRRRGYDSAASFLRHFGHLSAIVLCRASGGAVWLNPPARRKLPADLVAALRRAAQSGE